MRDHQRQREEILLVMLADASGMIKEKVKQGKGGYIVCINDWFIDDLT